MPRLSPDQLRSIEMLERRVRVLRILATAPEVSIEDVAYAAQEMLDDAQYCFTQMVK